MSPRFLLLLGAAVAAVWAYRRWRLAVQAVMVLIIVEGALRKWVLPGSQDLVYFAKENLTPSMLAALLLQETHSVSGLLNGLEVRDLV